MLKVDKLEFSGYGAPLCFDFEAPSGSLTLISGPSGQGKTTLLSIIAGFIKAQAGNIIFNNQNINHLEINKRPISILFQDHNLFPHLSIQDNVEIGVNPSLNLTASDKKRVAEVSKELGIYHFFDRYPDALSGGQRQRVSLARVLLRRRPLLLLDEPFVGLDYMQINKALSVIKKQQEKYNLTILLVSHQYDLVEKHADQVVHFSS